MQFSNVNTKKSYKRKVSQRKKQWTFYDFDGSRVFISISYDGRILWNEKQTLYFKKNKMYFREVSSLKNAKMPTEVMTDEDVLINYFDKESFFAECDDEPTENLVPKASIKKMDLARIAGRISVIDFAKYYLFLTEKKDEKQQC